MPSGTPHLPLRANGIHPGNTRYNTLPGELCRFLLSSPLCHLHWIIHDGYPCIRNNLFPLFCLSHSHHIVHWFTSSATRACVSSAGKWKWYGRKRFTRLCYKWPPAAKSYKVTVICFVAIRLLKRWTLSPAERSSEVVRSGVQGPDDDGSSALVQVFHLLRGRAPDAFLPRRSVRVPERSVNSKRARVKSVPCMKKSVVPDCAWKSVCWKMRRSLTHKLTHYHKWKGLF